MNTISLISIMISIPTILSISEWQEVRYNLKLSQVNKGFWETSETPLEVPLTENSQIILVYFFQYSLAFNTQREFKQPISFCSFLFTSWYKFQSTGNFKPPVANQCSIDDGLWQFTRLNHLA